MNYAHLVQAVQDKDDTRVNHILNEIRPILLNYLRVHKNAGTADAEDCVQDALTNSLKSIRENKIRKPEKILSFLLTATRHNYYRSQNRNKEIPYSSMDYKSTQPGEQLSRLVEEEQLYWFQVCLGKLSTSFRHFILHWFKYPDEQACEIAKHFDISVANAWTRKHRIRKKLKECLQRHLATCDQNSTSQKQHYKKIVNKVNEPGNASAE